MPVAVAICLALICTTIAGLVVAADRLGTFDGGGGHTRAAVSRAAREAARATRAGFGHLGQAGCLLTTELLEAERGWDFATQLRPDPRPLAELARGLTGTEVMPAADTGPMLAYRQITPKEVVDRNAAKFYPAPEAGQ